MATKLIRVPADLHADIKRRAQANGRTMVSELRKLIELIEPSHVQQWDSRGDVQIVSPYLEPGAKVGGPV